MIDATAVMPEHIAECLAAVEQQTSTPRHISVEDVERRLHFNGTDPAVDAKVYVLEGRVAAFAHLWRHGEQEVRVFARTRPASRGRGAGSTLLGWATGRAQELCRSCAITATSQSTDAAAPDLLLGIGFSPARQITTLMIDAGEVKSPTAARDDVRLQSYTDTNDAQLRIAHAIAFADAWGYEPAPSGEAWWAERADVDPASSLVAFIGDELVGFCLSADGRIAEIGVLPAYRRQGIGATLLQAGIEVLVAAGASQVSLQVDHLNGSGALPMYAKAGMRPLSSLTIWRRDSP